MNHFVFLSFYFGAKNGSPALGMANSLVVRRVSPGRIIVVLFWTKYAIPRQIKQGIHKLTTSRGQRNLCVFLFLLAAKKKAFIVSFRWDTEILTADRTAGSAAVCKDDVTLTSKRCRISLLAFLALLQQQTLTVHFYLSRLGTP